MSKCGIFECNIDVGTSDVFCANHIHLSSRSPDCSMPTAQYNDARKAYIKLTNSGELTENGDVVYVADRQIMDALDAFFSGH